MPPTEPEVREALKAVIDPEINMDIVNLGLIYEVKISPEGDVAVKMTLTSPFCPVGPELRQKAEETVMAMSGVKSSGVEIVFTPPWDPVTMASDEAKDKLGIW